MIGYWKLKKRSTRLHSVQNLLWKSKLWNKCKYFGSGNLIGCHYLTILLATAIGDFGILNADRALTVADKSITLVKSSGLLYCLPVYLCGMTGQCSPSLLVLQVCVYVVCRHHVH
jgi:hypothetical protein